jgi:hypothetical protein
LAGLSLIAPRSPSTICQLVSLVSAEPLCAAM